MLDIKKIQESIEDLEQSDTTMSNCSKLAALYTVRDHLLDGVQHDKVTKELSDILPEYTLYMHTKQQYHKDLMSKESVKAEMNKLCKELSEFIMMLYRCSDMPEEREALIKTLKDDIKDMGQN